MALEIHHCIGGGLPRIPLLSQLIPKRGLYCLVPLPELTHGHLIFDVYLLEEVRHSAGL